MAEASAQSVLDALREAYEDPEKIAQRWRDSGRRVARQCGVDVPREMLIAAGLLPVRMTASLDGILAADKSDRIVLSKADAQLPQLFAVLREMAALDEVQIGPVTFIDLVHLPRASSRRYNVHRLTQLRESLNADDASLSATIRNCNRQKRLLSEALQLRTGEVARITGVQALQLIGSASVLPVDDHIELLQSLIRSSASLRPVTGRRVFLTGSNHENADCYALIESCGALIVGEDHDWGDPWCADLVREDGSPTEALADPSLRTPLVCRSAAARRHAFAVGLARTRPDVVVHVSLDRDEAAPWDLVETRQLCKASSLPLLALEVTRTTDRADLRRTLERFLADPENYTPVAVLPPPSAAKAPRSRDGGRSRKSLLSVAAFGDYQREWFAQLRRRVASGEPLAVVNANAPQEILRALDIPFVVNQWWASIVAAKQQSGRYLNLLRSHDYPTDIDSYSSQGLAAIFDDDSKNAPWGGLPRPTFLQAVVGPDSTMKLFESWAKESDADLYLFERTVDTRWSLFRDWWSRLPDHWDDALESERVDLLTEELREAINVMERRTGKVFSPEKFAAVMTLVNEQEEYYERTRDLIATTVPAPVSIVDTMPATMVPQWHRGTEWGRDAARSFYEEVLQRVERGEAACANERVRLMWVGRGMWSDMGFYQRWEGTHGAVFVWSMYLALAADGYIRRFDRGRDPLRALAARVLTMGDELRMPTWAAAWHVREAQTHGVHGAVALADADPFVLRALERAGIPVLALDLDNFNQESADAVLVERSVTEFIEKLLSVATAR